MSFDDSASAVFPFIHACIGQSGRGFVPQLSGPVVVVVVVTTFAPPPPAVAVAVADAVADAGAAALAVADARAAALAVGSVAPDALAAADGAGVGEVAADALAVGVGVGSFWGSGFEQASKRSGAVTRARERDCIVRGSLIAFRLEVRDRRSDDRGLGSATPWSARPSS
jgi:hypothetical protein